MTPPTTPDASSTEHRGTPIDGRLCTDDQCWCWARDREKRARQQSGEFCACATPEMGSHSGSACCGNCGGRLRAFRGKGGPWWPEAELAARPTDLSNNANAGVAPTLVLFDSLPYGARFTYRGQTKVFVKLQGGGCGVIAEWRLQLNWPGQQVLSLADTDAERKTIKVEWIDVKFQATEKQNESTSALIAVLREHNGILHDLVDEARGTLADIGYSDDLTLQGCRKKARKHYDSIVAKHDPIDPDGD